MQTLLHGYAKDAAQQGILLLQRGAGAIDQGQLGFNSSSAFIAAFKKVTGMTPSVYQKLALNRDDS